MERNSPPSLTLKALAPGDARPWFVMHQRGCVSIFMAGFQVSPVRDLTRTLSAMGFHAMGFQEKLGI